MNSSSADRINTQVLVVGAGPVGLMAALRLREQGVDVRVIDQGGEHGAHSFPVVLHPLTLRMLSSLNLSEALFWRGRPVTELTIYTEGERRAVLELPQAAGISPGALTLPQDVLRKVLTHALATLGVSVAWETRLAVVQQDERRVRGSLMRRALPAPTSAAASEQSCSFEADFVVGADGYDSAVRAALGIELVPHGALSSYAFFDAPTQRAGQEAQVILADGLSNAVYPLQGNLARFSFQLTRSLSKAPDLSALQELVTSRLPWYGERIGGCEWSGIAEFRQALASSFGAGRIWLAGEAAHLTGPLGVQSLNVGLDEASELALHIGEALRGPSQVSFGVDYDQARRRQWRELLGLEARAVLGPRSPHWVRSNLSTLISCLPASGVDLDDLFAQLRLTPSSKPNALTPSG